MPGLPAPTGVGVPGFGLQHRATISGRAPGSPGEGRAPPCSAGGATALAPGFLEGVAPGAGGLALRLLGELGFFGRGRILFFQAPIPLLPGARGGWALILRGCVCVWGGVLIPAGEAWISFWMQDLAVGGAPGPLPQGPPPPPPLVQNLRVSRLEGAGVYPGPGSWRRGPAQPAVSTVGRVVPAWARALLSPAAGVICLSPWGWGCGRLPALAMPRAGLCCPRASRHVRPPAPEPGCSHLAVGWAGRGPRDWRFLWMAPPTCLPPCI